CPDAISRISSRSPVLVGQRFVQYTGQTETAGVPGTASPVNLRFVDTAGSIAGGLLPTGSITDVVTAGGTEYPVTLIDNGQPLVIMRAEDRSEERRVGKGDRQ